jgi:hypothetical protein
MISYPANATESQRFTIAGHDSYNMKNTEWLFCAWLLLIDITILYRLEANGELRAVKHIVTQIEILAILKFPNSSKPAKCPQNTTSTLQNYSAQCSACTVPFRPQPSRERLIWVTIGPLIDALHYGHFWRTQGTRITARAHIQHIIRSWSTLNYELLIDSPLYFKSI